MAAPSNGPADRPPGPDPVVPRIGRVRSRRRDGGQVWTLEIDEELAERTPFQPGQFNMLTAFGVGEAAISLSGDPAPPGCLSHTIRAVGPVSTALTELHPGDALGLRGPFGRGWPVAEAIGRDVLVVAGGLGLAPLRPALLHFRTERRRYGRVVLLYGTRSPDDILFRPELESWAQEADIEVRITVDHAAVGWGGHVGVVPTLVSRVDCEPGRTLAFVCGPEVMMRRSIDALRTVGIADEAVYLSMERNMKCALAMCGRCQFGPVFVCRDGPVFRYDRVRDLMTHREL